MKLLPKIVIMRCPWLEGAPRFYMLRRKGELWTENSTEIKLGRWMLFIERRPTVGDLAKARAKREADIERDIAAISCKPQLV